VSQQRVLFIDIETSPTLAWVWSQKQDYIPLEMVERHAQMLCFAAKFKGTKRTEFYSEWDHGHEEMVRQAHRLLEEADTVVHYNGIRFDTQWLDTEMKMLDLVPPEPFQQVDLYRQTVRFRAFSHKLQHISTYLLKLEGKHATGGFGLWRQVMDDMGIVPRKYDPNLVVKAQRLMRKYNVQDVDLLDEMWEPLLPWIKVPNANLFTGLEGCPRCERTDTLVRQGFKRNRSGKYQQYQCSVLKGGCGGWLTDTHRMASTNLVSA